MKTIKPSSIILAAAIFLALPAIASAQTIEIIDEGAGNRTATSLLVRSADKGSDIRFCNDTPRVYELTEQQMDEAISTSYDAILTAAEESTFGGAYTDGTVIVTTRTFIKNGRKKCTRRQSDGPSKTVRVDIEKEMFVVSAVLSYNDGGMAESARAGSTGGGCYFFCTEPPPTWPVPNPYDPVPEYPTYPTINWFQQPGTMPVGTLQTWNAKRQDIVVLDDCSMYETGTRERGNCDSMNDVKRYEYTTAYDPVVHQRPQGSKVREDMSIDIAVAFGNTRGWTNVYNYDPNHIDTSGRLYQPYDETLFISFTTTELILPW